jgi:putative transposase
VAVEAIRGEKTLSQLGSQFKVHPIQIAKWRKSALEQLPELFVDGRTRKGRNGEADSDALYEEIGGTTGIHGWETAAFTGWGSQPFIMGMLGAAFDLASKAGRP